MVITMVIMMVISQCGVKYTMIMVRMVMMMVYTDYVRTGTAWPVSATCPTRG